MRFDLSDDEREIQRTARELLGARASFARAREAVERDGAVPGTGATLARDEAPGADRGTPGRDIEDAVSLGRGAEDGALWVELRDLGWPGIAVAERYGGGGLGLVALAVLAEELGRTVAPVPFLGTALAALVVEHDGTDAQRERWLATLASGELRGAATLSGGGARDGAGAAGGSPVPGAAEDGLVAVLDRAGGGRLLAPGSGVVTPVRAVDPTRGHGLVAPGPDPAQGDRLAASTAGLDRAAVIVGAELVGVIQRALEMTVAYVKERRQFGVAVGTFQAVQHGAAQMLRDVETARVAVYQAAWAADAEPDLLPMAAAMAKAAASDAGRTVTAAAVQLHGGIGFTWEADVHWLLKRAQIDAVLLGGAGHHRRRIAGVLRDRAQAAVASVVQPT